MTTEQALQYIHSVSWMGSRPGLSRTEELLHRLGDPHKQLRFVHVAGTNGKGSTCAMLASILQAAGLRTGLYTSPYILRFHERIRVNGEDIPDEALAEITARVRVHAEQMEDHPTEFELVSAIGFCYFAEQACDVVVLEVGLGGALDSTNVIPAPLLALITEIDFDHMGVLGNTIEEIAAAKAGIIKTGTTVLSADNLPSAAAVIHRVAAERGCPCTTPAYDRLTDRRQEEGGISFCFDGERYFVALAGEYQFRNACMAMTAARSLAALGLPITTEHIRAGLASVRWRARFERLGEHPLFYYDGGHNPQGVAAAVRSYTARYPDTPATVLMGVMADKDYAVEIETLLPIAHTVVTVRPDNPRALPAEALAQKIQALGGRAVAAETVEQGVRLAVLTAAEQRPVLALGSLYMYAEVHAAYRALFGDGTAAADH